MLFFYGNPELQEVIAFLQFSQSFDRTDMREIGLDFLQRTITDQTLKLRRLNWFFTVR